MIHGIFTIATILLGAAATIGIPGVLLGLIFFPTVVLPIITTVSRTFLSCTWCIVVVVFILATVASYWIGRWGEYDRGVNETIAKIARNDDKLVGRAIEARKKLKDCQARNGTWIQSTGDCR